MTGESVLSDGYITHSILQIQRLKARYFRFVDTKNWNELADLFTPDALLWFAEHEDEAIPFASALKNNIQKILTGATSLHHGHMPEIEVVSETTASGIWPMESRVYWPSNRASIGLVFSHGYGHYHENYVKHDGKWRIHRLKLTQLWKQNIPAPLAVT